RETGRLRRLPCARDVERREGAHVLLARVDRRGAEIDDIRRVELAAFDAARKIEGLQHQAAPSISPTTRSLTRFIGLPLESHARLVAEPVATSPGHAPAGCDPKGDRGSRPNRALTMCAGRGGERSRTLKSR